MVSRSSPSSSLLSIFASWSLNASQSSRSNTLLTSPSSRNLAAGNGLASSTCSNAVLRPSRCGSDTAAAHSPDHEQFAVRREQMHQIQVFRADLAEDLAAGLVFQLGDRLDVGSRREHRAPAHDKRRCCVRVLVCQLEQLGELHKLGDGEGVSGVRVVQDDHKHLADDFIAWRHVERQREGRNIKSTECGVLACEKFTVCLRKGSVQGRQAVDTSETGLSWAFEHQRQQFTLPPPDLLLILARGGFPCPAFRQRLPRKKKSATLQLLV
ncbi:hypothetical protein KL909_001068 [Ogataea angusta]|nr:hypothetical protein KL909_001068 [Ogataea angusta]